MVLNIEAGLSLIVKEMNTSLIPTVQLQCIYREFITKCGSFVDHLCYLFIVFVMLARMFIAALWSPEIKGLTSWLLLMMFIVILLLS